MRMRTVALASIRGGSKQQHHPSVRRRKPFSAAWLVALWGASGGNSAQSIMAYATRSRTPASLNIAPAFAFRLASASGTRQLAPDPGCPPPDNDRCFGRRRGKTVTTGAACARPVILRAPACRAHGSMLATPSRRQSSSDRWAIGGARLSSPVQLAHCAPARRRSLATLATKEKGGFDSAELLKLSYRELQQLAKANKVRANQTIQGIVDDLVALEEIQGTDVPRSYPTGRSGGRGDEQAGQGILSVLPEQQEESRPTDMTGLKGGEDHGDGWVSFRLSGDDALDLDERLEAEGIDQKGDWGLDADDDDADMDARLRDAVAMNDHLSEDVLNSNPQEFGFDEDRINLDKLAITVPKGCCPGCGSKFQSDDDKRPGYLQADKLGEMLAKESGMGTLTAEDLDMDPEVWLAMQSDVDPRANDDQADGLRASGTSGASPASGGRLGRASRDAAALTASASATVPISAGVQEREDAAEVVALEEEEKEEKLTVCQRCHRLRYYGSVEESLRPGFSDSDLLTPQRFLELLGSLRTQRCLIIYLVDLFDFHGTFLYNLPKITGNNPVLVAGNKVDLLPKDLGQERVTKWVRDKCREAGLPGMEMRDVHLISSKHGVGIAPLMRKAREQALRGKRDIYVLGAANVGKSTFINYIIDEKGNNGGGETRRRRGRSDGSGGKGSKRPVAGRGVTVSNVPGTTLDFVKVDLGEKRALYDTPGLLMPHTLTSRLTPPELRAAIPSKKVDHVTYRVGEGKVVLLGGLARVEVVEGRPFLLTFFMSNDVRLHPTDVSRVSDMLSGHVGRGKMLFPPFEPERVQEIGGLVPTDFDILGAGWREAAADVVIAGLGWVSLTGAGPVTLRVWAPRGVLVMAREPLLPYESWETTAKFTGGTTVKKGRKKQGRRA